MLSYKKIILGMFIIFFILLIACVDKKTENDLVNNDKTISSKSPKESDITIDNEISPLSTEDFTIYYEDTTINIGENPISLFKKIGKGTANEDNNYGFIGWDNDNRYKFYSFGYPEKNPVVYITTKLEVANNKAIISQIKTNVLTTKRGIKAGDTYDRMVELYGTPSTQLINESQHNIAIYELEELSLNFYINEDQKISNIKIIYVDKE